MVFLISRHWFAHVLQLTCNYAIRIPTRNHSFFNLSVMTKFLFSKHIALWLFFLFLSACLWAQGVTTASMIGRVSDNEGKPAAERQVVATHIPSGTRYAGTTSSTGQYTLSGLRVGGPYKVEVLAGNEQGSRSIESLTLGETRRLDILMEEKVIETLPIRITVKKITEVVEEIKDGARTDISLQQINTMPTIERNLRDYVRLVPQLSIIGDGISVAGMNNRYNTIYIDGAVNNDVYGLATAGTNGGQTGISPLSPDAIEQITVNVSPYDVSIGGFAGGSINAVTRSGSNQLQASAYSLFRSQRLAGTSPDAAQTKLDAFTARTSGFRIGAPIIKNKLFLFLNAEVQRDETPRPFDASTYLGASSVIRIDSLTQKLGEYDYNPQGYTQNTSLLSSNKIFARIDYNFKKYHKLTLRHSYTYGEGTVPVTSSTTAINYYANGSLFKSTTNSSAAELNTTFGRISNSLILGYTHVNDDRDPMSVFPSISIRDGRGFISVGSNASSIATYVKQGIVTLTDNLKFVKGNHTISGGMHHELYNIENLFISNNYGLYSYDSLGQFLRGIPATSYRRGYAIGSDGTGDNSGGAAKFRALQMAFYAQEEWQATKQLRISAGVRVDMPILLNQPLANPRFNDTTLANLKAAGYDVSDIQSGKGFDAHPMIAPRIGFNYALSADRKAILRGGVGVFTSR